MKAVALESYLLCHASVFFFQAEDGIRDLGGRRIIRSEEHTSELQSRSDLVCRLLLEKKKKTHQTTTNASLPPQPVESTASTLHHNCPPATPVIINSPARVQPASPCYACH